MTGWGVPLLLRNVSIITAKHAPTMAVFAAVPVTFTSISINYHCQDHGKQYQNYYYSLNIIISSTSSIIYHFWVLGFFFFLTSKCFPNNLPHSFQEFYCLLFLKTLVITEETRTNLREVKQFDGELGLLFYFQSHFVFVWVDRIHYHSTLTTPHKLQIFWGL